MTRFVKLMRLLMGVYVAIASIHAEWVILGMTFAICAGWLLYKSQE